MKNAQPKLDCTIFLDRTHGKTMASLLRRVGLKVKTIYQVYPKTKHERVKDPQWIAKCGAKGWIAISGDKRLEKNVENRKAVIDARCKVFVLTDTHSLGEEWAAAVIVGRTKIDSVIRKNNGPFFATIAKRSDSHVSHARFPRDVECETTGAEAVIVKVEANPTIERVTPTKKRGEAHLPPEGPGLFVNARQKENG